MKRICFLVFILLCACGGTLTEEQRKKIKEEMENKAIKKLSEAQITEGAYALGRDVAKQIDRSAMENRSYLDSLQRTYKVRILLLQPGDSAMLRIEQQIIEAYTAGGDASQLADNIQKLSADSILYTKPIMKKMADGSIQFDFALGVRLSKKEVILSIKP